MLSFKIYKEEGVSKISYWDSKHNICYCHNDLFFDLMKIPFEEKHGNPIGLVAFVNVFYFSDFSVLSKEKYYEYLENGK